MPAIKIDLSGKLMVISDNIRKRVQAAIKDIGIAGKEKITGGAEGKKDKKDKDSKEEKNQSGLMMAGLGKLAVIAALLKGMKPIQDALKLIGALLFVFIYGGIQKLIKGLGDAWEREKKFYSGIWKWIKALPGRIWEFLKTLPGKIWEFLKIGFNWAKGLLKSVWEGIKALGLRIWEGLKNVWVKVKSIGEKIWEGLKVTALKIWEGLKKVWTFIKNLPGWIWNKLKIGFQWIKDKVQLAIDWIKKLPQLIWDKIKALGSTIASAISGVINDLISKIPFIGGKKEDDFISRPGGGSTRFNPNDTIIGVKNPGTLGGTKNFYFYGTTSDEMMNTIKRELGTNVFTSTRF